MAERFLREGDLLVGRLDEIELRVLVELLGQTRVVVEPPAADAGAQDPFAQMIAGCGLEDLGAAEIADDASALLDRDPALDRIVPPAHREDEVAAAEYRRFTERSIRARKAEGLSRAAELLRSQRPGRVSLTEPDASGLAVALTDVRLLLGERLGLREDDDMDALEAQAEHLDPSSPLVVLLSYYEFVTWLQEVLVIALMGDDLE